MPEYEGHRARQRQKYHEFGLHMMPDYEALELLLFYAIPRSDTRPLAHRLLREFGSLHGVFSASEAELRGVEGVGESTALLLSMLMPLWQRIHISAPCERILDNSERLGAYFCEIFYGMQREQLYAAAIDTKGKLITCRRLFEGDCSTVNLDLRRLTSFANGVGATYIALAHNHPSGVATPSADDVNATRLAIQALAPFKVHLFDHVIVADNDYVSLRQSGALEY